MNSTGIRTEILIVIALVLGMALLADFAGKWNLSGTAETAALVGGLLAQVLAVVTARARQGEVKRLKNGGP